MKTGIELIAAERERQIKSEGWTLEHDDTHVDREILQAALSYAMCSMNDADYNDAATSEWPFNATWWKPSEDPIRNLTKAGALIAAEIDRLQRAKPVKKRHRDRPPQPGRRMA